MGVCQVMEGRHCFQHLTVEENLLTGAFTRNGVARRDRRGAREGLSLLPAPASSGATSQAGYTSGGEQQMTAIGRALMARPSMILLDEPSMGLAPQIVEEIFEIVRDLNAKERVSFLLAEQNTMVALRYAELRLHPRERPRRDGRRRQRARAERGREGVLPRPVDRRAARASATSSTTAAASAGCAMIELAYRAPATDSSGAPTSAIASAARCSPCSASSAARRQRVVQVRSGALPRADRRAGIVPAPYLARAHWVQVEDAKALTDAQARELVAHSHALIFAKLTRQDASGDRRAGRRAMSEHFDTLETRDPELREREQLAALRGRSRTRRRTRRRSRSCSPTSIRRRSRRATRWRSCRSRASPSSRELQKAVAPVRRPRGDALGRARAACSRRPGRSTSPKGARPTTGASRARCSPPAFAPATSCTTASPITSRRRARCSRRGAHALGCTVFPGGTGQTELQVQAMADLRPDGYVGTPSFLQDHPREGRRAGRRRCRR